MNIPAKPATAEVEIPPRPEAIIYGILKLVMGLPDKTEEVKPVVP